jgi:hypothetical protein
VDNPHDEIVRAVSVVHNAFDRAPGVAPTAIIVVPADASMDAVAETIRTSLSAPALHSGGRAYELAPLGRARQEAE